MIKTFKEYGIMENIKNGLTEIEFFQKMYDFIQDNYEHRHAMMDFILYYQYSGESGGNKLTDDLEMFITKLERGETPREIADPNNNMGL